MFSARFLATASLLSLAALAAHPAAAQTTVIGFPSSGYGGENNAAFVGQTGFSLGFEFTATSAVSVTSLGYFYDPSYAPSTPTFAQPHSVGLYNDSGELITSADVTLQGIPDGYFFYTDIAPVALVTGEHYIIAGETGTTDPYLYDFVDSDGNSAITVASGIHYDQNRSTVSDILKYADSTNVGVDPGFFGPNFKISPTISAAPEPGEWSLLGLTALGLGGLVLRARRRSLRSL